MWQRKLLQHGLIMLLNCLTAEVLREAVSALLKAVRAEVTREKDWWDGMALRACDTIEHAMGIPPEMDASEPDPRDPATSPSVPSSLSELSQEDSDDVAFAFTGPTDEG